MHTNSARAPTPMPSGPSQKGKASPIDRDAQWCAVPRNRRRVRATARIVSQVRRRRYTRIPRHCAVRKIAIAYPLDDRCAGIFRGGRLNERALGCLAVYKGQHRAAGNAPSKDKARKIHWQQLRLDNNVLLPHPMSNRRWSAGGSARQRRRSCDRGGQANMHRGRLRRRVRPRTARLEKTEPAHRPCLTKSRRQHL